MNPRRVAKALAGFGAAALAALVVITVHVVKRRSLTLPAARLAGLVPGALLHARDFHWTQMKGGQQQWVLTARDASYSNDRTSIVMSDAMVSMTGADGKQIAVQASRAALALNGNHVIRADLTGGATIRDGDLVLSTGQVTFLPDDDEVEAPGLVTIQGDGLKVTAIGLSGHAKSQQFRLLKQVSTEIAPGAKGGGRRQG